MQGLRIEGLHFEGLHQQNKSEDYEGGSGGKRESVAFESLKKKLADGHMAVSGPQKHAVQVRTGSHCCKKEIFRMEPGGIPDHGQNDREAGRH